MKYLFPIFLSTFLFVYLSGCGEHSSSSYPINEDSIEDNESPTHKSKSGSQHSQRRSYTHFAAENKNLCPKLLQRHIDSPTITRKDEYMRDSYCDYYLYPEKGQQLNINSYGSTVTISLLMPEFYDFANGPYTVKENRRHIIRVKYNGIQSRPNKFSYSIDFSLN